MRIYIAGPMRGFPEFNFAAFDEAAARGRAQGHEIVSPADLDRGAGFSAEGQDGKVDALGHSAAVTPEFIRGAAWRDFHAIVGPDAVTAGVDAVAMLPGWENSRGARGEKCLAEWIGLLILDARTFRVLDEVKPPAWKPEEIPNGEFVLKSSGDKQTFATGAVRDANAGKGYFHLMPYLPLERIAQLYEAGARKYGKNNWRKGIPCSRYIDSAFRHLGKLADGQVDEDHAAAVAWNLFGFIWTEAEAKAGRLPNDLLDMPQHSK